jgi:hypothetical protein
MPSKKYYWQNPEKFREKTNAYRLAHPEWKKKSGREWMAKKRATDPEQKIKETAWASAAYKRDPEGKKAKVLEWIRAHPGYYMLKNAQFRARRGGYPCTITLEDIVIPEFCPVLGIKLGTYIGKGRGGFKDDAPSLDKVIPSKGYVKGNVCVISNRANAIKRDASLDELRLVVAYIEHQTNSDPVGW